MLNKKEMVQNNQDFLSVYPKVASYSRQKPLDVNRKKSWLGRVCMTISILQKDMCVKHAICFKQNAQQNSLHF